MSNEFIEENPKLQEPKHSEDESIDPALVREELARILSSRHFQTSRRGKEFLRHVVDQKIGGNAELLKERLIGVKIFGRKADYSTGEDPVVRVQAGDVRRRLERYHADADIRPIVLIEIPLGTYVPVFRMKDSESEHEIAWQPILQAEGLPSSHEASAISGTSGTEEATIGDEITNSVLPRDPADQYNSVSISSKDGHGFALQPDTPFVGQAKDARWSWRAVGWWILPILVCAATAGYFSGSRVHRQPDSVTKAFWQPASIAPRPVLLCLPRPMVYRPADKLFDKYAAAHPDAMSTREARQDQILPLDPKETIQWGDMIPVRSSGPGIGGVMAAINMSKLLTEQGIRFEARFGKEGTYAEMRDSPVLIIGGINTEWSPELMGESSFAFDQSRSSPNIHETGSAKRVWTQETSGGHVTRDYGLITRQLSGRAGQFFVQVAGISHYGTAAASELLVQPQGLEKVFRAYPVNLQNKNLQILVSTDVTDERAGPPHVVAVSSW